MDGMKMRCFQRIIRTLGKAGSNFVMVVWNDSISIRSINEYQSALPIIQFKSSFFDEFKFTYNESQLSFEVPSNAFKYSLLLSNQSAITPEKIILSISIDKNESIENDFKFTINVFDYFEINHYWEFYVTKNASVLKAVVDPSNIISTLNCRYDIFEGMEKIFNKNNMITLHIYNTKKPKTKKEKKFPIMFTTEKLNYDDSVASILRFEINDKLNIEIDDESFDLECNLENGALKLSFSLFDFLIGVKIASILSQRVIISVSSPGNPIIIKASMPNAASFEMTIATCIEDNKSKQTDDEDDGKEYENPRKTNKNNPIVYAPSESERGQYLIDNT